MIRYLVFLSMLEISVVDFKVMFVYFKSEAEFEVTSKYRLVEE